MARVSRSRDVWLVTIVSTVRATTLALGLLTLAPEGLDSPAAASLGLVAVVAVGATAANFALPHSRVTAPVEAVLSAAAIAAGGLGTVALLPYIAVPSFAAGMLVGLRFSLAVSSLSALVLAVMYYPWTAAEVQQALTWAAVAVGVGVLSGWIHRLRPDAQQREAESYAEAERLLDELRSLVRPLSGGLDARPIAQGLLDELTGRTGHVSAAVFLGREPSDRYLAAATGDPPADGWLDESGAFGADDWLVLPVLHSGTQIASVVVSRTSPTPTTTQSAERVINRWAPRLAAAALYDEVQEVATRAERSRIAREMHDGVAQDVASLGYLADDLVAHASPDLVPRIDELRAQIARVVTELRLSIHDLRSDDHRGGRLSGAIADLARREAQAGGMRLHLRVQEVSYALPASVEHDLLRITQEAIVNARKHSHAANLWVWCTLGPGGAVITVEDDGNGLSAAQEDGIGMLTMTERAARVGATFTLEPRHPRGTLVRVDMPLPPPR